jgi:hypothetical protein
MGKNVRLSRLLLSKAAHAALNPDLLQNNRFIFHVSGYGDTEGYANRQL